MNIPMWKVLPGLMTQFDKMFVIAQFGAATNAIQAATVDGDLENGVQFIGQCQGMIDDIPHVDDLVQRIVMEARKVHMDQMDVFEQAYQMVPPSATSKAF
jgi:enoyl-[acyl-carrier protein] reductase II